MNFHRLDFAGVELLCSDLLGFQTILLFALFEQLLHEFDHCCLFFLLLQHKFFAILLVLLSFWEEVLDLVHSFHTYLL